MSDERRPTYRIEPHPYAAPTLAAGLYVVATPIGNLGDVTLRALQTLAAADLVACEDTRVTRRLTERYAIETPLLAYHAHNEARQAERILGLLAEGKAVALVSDAGTPLVSDPGERLVAAAVAAGHPVFAVPGASALTAALSISGLATAAVHFDGFLPQKAEARRRRLRDLAAHEATLVFYEAPHRLAESLADMAAELGADRPAAVARELTKLHETVLRDGLAALAARFAAEGAVKGEIVVLVGPPPPAGEPDGAEIDRRLAELLADHSVSAAAALAAEEMGLPRRRLYARALALKGGRDGA
ncbi:MAG: 16S rRNA (cytidine(1402)-2'-O)-methyltransferase [Bauldia sp.]